MRVLAIKQPWASLVAEGKKTIEVRSRPTNIREKVAIYGTISPYDKRANVELGMFMPRGYIVATVEIVDCIQYMRTHEAVRDMHKHCIPLKTGDELQHMYAWYLDNVEILDTPIPYKMPKGCVVWANAELDL